MYKYSGIYLMAGFIMKSEVKVFILSVIASFLNQLKVGSFSFECIIILLIYFINYRKAPFTRI